MLLSLEKKPRRLSASGNAKRERRMDIERGGGV